MNVMSTTPSSRTKMSSLFLVVLVVCFGAVLCVSPWIGLSEVPYAVLFENTRESQAASIFWQLRVPRVISAFLIGIALSLGGLVFQALFRNALASPFTLGVSGGAALGAALTFQFGVAVAASTVVGSLMGVVLTILMTNTLFL